MKYIFLLFVLSMLSCNGKENDAAEVVQDSLENSSAEEGNVQMEFPKVADDAVALVVLGNCQDGGSPHAGCENECCADLFDQPDPERMVVSLGLVDQITQERYLFEASPDLPRQMYFLEHCSNFGFDEAPDGVFLTHAHIGHYAGLMHLGREAMNAQEVPVFAMPKMQDFLETNGPWSQLVRLKNIVINSLENETTVSLNENLSVIPFLVPHRDEFSETVGFKIIGPNKSALFIPDVDKWEKWDKDIIKEITAVDYAFIDATFYDQNELKNRDMTEIPHPFVVESMQLFDDLPEMEKNKVIFIHLNHTNPLLNQDSDASLNVLSKGFGIARKGDIFYL